MTIVFNAPFGMSRLVYTGTGLVLMCFRLRYYARRRKLLYTLDLCYWVHMCGFYELWFGALAGSAGAERGAGGAPGEWAVACLASAVGPVGGAVFMLQSPMLLHHPEAFESFFLHALRGVGAAAPAPQRCACRRRGRPPQWKHPQWRPPQWHCCPLLRSGTAALSAET